MTEDNSSNLPILDDIIKTGDVDKAASAPDRQARNDTPAADDAAAPASMTVFTETAMPGNDTAALASDGQEPQACNLPDIEALTEEILFSILPELEQTLREKIRQALARHFNDTGGTD
jgi:hypothetical protein